MTAAHLTSGLTELLASFDPQTVTGVDVSVVIVPGPALGMSVRVHGAGAPREDDAAVQGLANRATLLGGDCGVTESEEELATTVLWRVPLDDVSS